MDKLINELFVENRKTQHSTWKIVKLIILTSMHDKKGWKKYVSTYCIVKSVVYCLVYMVSSGSNITSAF